MATAATLPAEVMSPVHNGTAHAKLRLDPRTWIVAFVSVAIWTSMTTSLIGAGVTAALILLAAFILRRGFVAATLQPRVSPQWIVMAALLTIILYTLFGTSRGSEGIRVFGLSIEFDAIRLGILMALRLTSLLVLSFILLSSVPALEMAAGLTRFLLPLRKVGIPVADLYYLTFFLSRMIPSLIHESRIIALAQRSRGVGSRVSGFGGWRSYPARVLPVFASALRRSDAMALLFASRGFDSRHIPVRVSALRFESVDFTVLGALSIGWAVWLYLRLGGV